MAVNPATIASPAQIRAILAQVNRIRPELAAFFGGLYYAALHPEKGRRPSARRSHPPGIRARDDHPRRRLSRSGTASSSTGEPHEARGLKHRPDGMNYVVPNPPVLVRIPHRPMPHQMRYALASTSWMPGHPG